MKKRNQDIEIIARRPVGTRLMRVREDAHRKFRQVAKETGRTIMEIVV